MKQYLVTIPIVGNVSIYVEAETEEEALDKAFDAATIKDINEWEPIMEVGQGNVCYHPHPWTAEAEEIEEI